MDVEASITERLQKLRQWQVEQQERLLKQQRIQREILSHEQDRIYKALGLPTHNFDIIGSTEDMSVMHEIEKNAKETMSDEALMLQRSATNSDNILEIIDKGLPTSVCVDELYENYNKKKEESNDSDCISTIVDRSGSSMRNCSLDILSQELSDSLIEGIKPLSLNDVSNKCTSIDDIPLPSPKKDFRTLLEEKLKRESEIMSNAQTDARIKPKKPFLKKGQGLSRFKMSTNVRPPTATTKRHNTPLSCNTQHIDRSDKNKKSTVHKHTLPKTRNNVSVANGKRQLNLKTVPLPKTKILNESITPTNRITNNVTSNRSRYPPEINISDCDSKAEKELEEVRIFELLEEKAENSSFCSTSSTVLAFLQQSTPFKVKSGLNQTRRENNTVTSKRQQDDERKSDTIEQEPMVRVMHTGNSKSSIQRQVEPRKHSHTNATTIDSYWDTVTVDNMQEETQSHFMPTNEVLQSNEAYTKQLENHNTSIVSVLSNSDEETDTSMGNARNLTHNSEADTSHHVRFSEYNEYRTIDLIDVSDTTSTPPLKDYFEQQNWDDRSDTSNSPDVKRKLPFNCEEQIQNSSQKIISNEKAVGTPRSSLQQDITRRNKKDAYNHVMETELVSEEEEDALSYRDESPDEDICYDNECMPIIEEIGRTSDEERSVLSSSSSSSSLLSLSSDARELNTHKRKEYVFRNEPGKITEKIAKVYSNLEKADLYSSEARTNQTGTFETELLKSRLLELEKEIDIFRKESSALLLQRRKLQEEEAILCKRYVEKEKNFEENKRRVQNQLEEEKKRVAREKIAMENRIRDAQEKARQSKMERQKTQDLQEQLAQLRDELNIKESRWNAAESRYKSEMRVLRVEISKLKQEITNLQNIKRTNVRNLRKSSGQLITKAINQINKRVVVAPSKDPPPMRMCQDLSDTSSDTSAHDDEDKSKSGNKSVMNAIHVDDDFGKIEDDVNKVKYKQVEIESQPKDSQTFPGENLVEKRRHLYENLLKDATSDLVENQNSSYTKGDMLSDPQPIVTQIQHLNTKSDDRSYSCSTNKDLEHTAYVANNIEHYANRSREVNKNSGKNDMENERRKDRILSPEKNLNSTLHPSSQSQISRTSMDAVKQIQFSDGRIEYWYPNGNVKKVFPDQEITKMIYYNGDVRETDKNRRVKYFYAATRTWHTTTPDGLEILEFPEYVYFVIVSSLHLFIPLLCFIFSK